MDSGAFRDVRLSRGFWRGWPYALRQKGNWVHLCNEAAETKLGLMLNCLKDPG